jgi:hypothetical protein
MIEQKPYNPGEVRRIKESDYKDRLVLICGHIWWPVEKVNAYHCILLQDDKLPEDPEPKYIWDTSHGKWEKTDIVV